MELSPVRKMILGAVIMAFGIAVLADYSLAKAVLYISFVVASVVLFR